MQGLFNSEAHGRLQEDGKASVTQTNMYQVSDGTLNGLYVQGWGRAKPVFYVANSEAWTDSRARIALEFKDLGDKFDIVLADGRWVSRYPCATPVSSRVWLWQGIPGSEGRMSTITSCREGGSDGIYDHTISVRKGGFRG